MSSPWRACPSRHRVVPSSSDVGLGAVLEVIVVEVLGVAVFHLGIELLILRQILIGAVAGVPPPRSTGLGAFFFFGLSQDLLSSEKPALEAVALGPLAGGAAGDFFFAPRRRRRRLRE